MRRGVAGALTVVGARAQHFAVFYDEGADGDLAHLAGASSELERNAHELLFGAQEPAPNSTPTSSSWTRPLLESALPVPSRRAPEKSVNFPPDSSTITWRAATSHSEQTGSTAASSAPSATSMCCQKSPKPRSRPARRATSRKASGRLKSPTEPDETLASAKLATLETRMRSAGPPALQTNAPLPRSAHHRRPRTGEETTPRFTSPSSSSAIKVAQTGTPLTKLAVPSIGSIIQRRRLLPLSPPSSPTTASPGRRSPRATLRAASTKRSTSLTKVRSFLVSTTRPLRRDEGMVKPSAMSAKASARARSGAIAGNANPQRRQRALLPSSQPRERASRAPAPPGHSRRAPPWPGGGPPSPAPCGLPSPLRPSPEAEPTGSLRAGATRAPRSLSAPKRRAAGRPRAQPKPR